MSYAGIAAALILTQNVVLDRLLGLCPLVAATRSRESTVAIGSALLFVGALSGVATWAVYRLVLVPLRLELLETAAFMLLVAGSARVLEALARTASPLLYAVLRPHLDHTTTNSAVLGLCFVAVRSGFGMMQSLVAAVAGTGGFFLVAGILGSIRAKLELEWVPRPLRGAPIVLIAAGLMALAFMAFEGAARVGGAG